MRNVAGAEAVESVEGNTCALAMQEASSGRGRGPHQARKDRVGTWETSSRPQSLLAVPGHGRKPKRRSCRGRGEESDGLIVPVKRRTKPAAPVAEVVEGRRAGRGELMAATDVPGTVPDQRLRCAVITGAGTGWAAQAPNAGADDSRQEPDAVKTHVRIRAGGAGQLASLPRPGVTRGRLGRSTGTAAPGSRRGTRG